MHEQSGGEPRAKRKRWLRWLIEALVLILILYLVQLWQTRNAPEGEAPALEGITLQGERFSLQQRERRPLLIYFWADWCPVCGMTSGSVERLSHDHSVITVAMQSGDAENVSQHLEAHGLSFPVILDDQGSISRRWNVRGVPSFFVLDADNRIQQVAVGYTSSWGLRARLWLAER